MNPKTAYVYTHTPIVPFGSGTQIRQFTNVRAYLDLGYDVEVIQFTSSKQTTNPEVILPEGASHTLVQAEPRTPSLHQRLAYRVGFPLEAALGVMSMDRQSILEAVKERERATPGAIHHFEYSATANVAISLRDPRLNLIWSCHDWESDRNRKVGQMRQEAGRRKSAIERLRSQYFSRRVETQTAQHCKLVLMIADHETRIFREQLGIQNAELLPMSWPNETMPPRVRDWGDGGVLRLLHVGSPDAMVGYYSLKFLLGDVLPLIPESLRSRMEFLIAGRLLDTEYSRSIRRLAENFPQVKFLGYVEDVRSLYASTDAQLVGTPIATGLRTRIIESFVCGLPVVSIPAAAEGITGLTHGENIFLENSPDAFARRLIQLLDAPTLLGRIATNARSLYEQSYSRRVAADRLRFSLEKYIHVH